MSGPKNGGPAFPSPVDPHRLDDKGMTLRDYFAAKAMVAYLSQDHGRNRPEMAEIAGGAYRMADAMLAARGAA